MSVSIYKVCLEGWASPPKNVAKIKHTHGHLIWFKQNSSFGLSNARFGEAAAISAKFLLKNYHPNQTIKRIFALDLENALNKFLSKSIYSTNVNRLIGLDGI